MTMNTITHATSPAEQSCSWLPDRGKDIRNWQSRLRACLHIVAALLLAIFVIIHEMALARHFPRLLLYNTVFPFLTNNNLYLFSMALEGGLAFLCFTCRGRNVADNCIIGFVVLLLWYRTALSWTGGSGSSCGCMGILTLLFRWTKGQETFASVASLVVLVICASPGLFSRGKTALLGLKTLGRIAPLLMLCSFSLKAKTIEL